MKTTDSTFKDYFFLSCALHFVLFLFLWVSSYLNSHSPAPKQTQVTWLKLGNSFTEKQSGDLSLGPDFKRLENQKTSPELSPKKETKNEVHTQKTEIKTKVNDQKIIPTKTLSINEKPTKNTSTNITQNKQNTSSGSQNTKSNNDDAISKALSKINQSGSGEGGTSSQSIQGSAEGNSIKGGLNTECSSYKGIVKRRVQANWAKLKTNSTNTRAAQAYIRINASGAITSIQWQQKSGDFVSDQAAARALQNSSPFPAPPAQCSMALLEGITIRF